MLQINHRRMALPHFHQTPTLQDSTSVKFNKELHLFAVFAFFFFNPTWQNGDFGTIRSRRFMQMIHVARVLQENEM